MSTDNPGYPELPDWVYRIVLTKIVKALGYEQGYPAFLIRDLSQPEYDAFRNALLEAFPPGAARP